MREHDRVAVHVDDPRFGRGPLGDLVDAMRPTIVLPIAVLAVAALSCLAIKGGPVQPAQAGTEEAIKAPTTAA